MPARVPRAGFAPLPVDLDLPALVESHKHWDYVTRFTYAEVKEKGVDELERLVKKHVIKHGKPIVIEGFHEVLDPWTFSARWLKDNVGDKVENARDLNEQKQLPLTIRHYLNSINAVTNQHFRPVSTARAGGPQRIYLKDIDCPEVWQQRLAEVIPPFLYYLNDSSGEIGGPGAKVLDSVAASGQRLGKGIAAAGDLMSSFPEHMRAENLMCYIGHEGTYTPAHREMCATMGHNIMVDTSIDFDDDGKPERPGSSIWFMTEANDRQIVSEYWLSKLGHDIEVERHFAQLASWERAPFNVYIVDQKVGDLVLIPPLAPHQVWNRGTRTMKVAWNRSTVETLEMALSEAVPKAKIVCRDEQYKTKAMVYYTLMKYSALLSEARHQAGQLPSEAGVRLLHKGKVRQLLKDFRKLFSLFKTVMLSEMMSPDGTADKCEYLPFESNVTCAYCRGNIFNRFLSCPACPEQLDLAEPEPYDVCMECYAMGRSCRCISGLRWMEQFKWHELTAKYDSWRQLIIDLTGDPGKGTPLTLTEERRRRHNKTLAEVVREQIKRRPFVDITRPMADLQADNVTDEEIVVDDDGKVKKRVKKHSKEYLSNHATCHVCKTREPKWKMAQCTRCDKWWCYATLYRGHDDMPLDIMENPDWECVHCQNVCFAGSCRLDPRQKPYQPKGTLLGHDTKQVADERSVEALVDFRVSNMNWIREEEGQEESIQMRRAIEAAEKAHDAVNGQGQDDVDAEDAEDIEDEIIMPDDPEDEFLDPELRSENDMARRLLDYNRTNASTNGLGHEQAEALNDRSDEPHNPAMYPLPIRADSHPEVDDVDTQATVHSSPKLRDVVANGKRGRRSEGTGFVMSGPKRRRATDMADRIASRSANVASKQYREMQERKALDEAKRAGRWIMVKAALRNRSKVVRIKLSGNKLRRFMAQAEKTIADHSLAQQTQMEENITLLQSDIQKPVEQKRARHASQRKRKRKEKDSDVEDSGVATDDGADVTAGPPNGKRMKGSPRKVPAYLHKAGDEALPDELPDGFRMHRTKKAGADPQSGKSKAAGVKGKQGLSRSAPRPASNTEAESNRLAKLQAFRAVNGGDAQDPDLDQSINEVASAAFAVAKQAAVPGPRTTDADVPASIPASHNASGAKPARKSIFDKVGGVKGKKIKISARGK